MATGSALSFEAGGDPVQRVHSARPEQPKDGVRPVRIDNGAPHVPGPPSASAREAPQPAHQRLVFSDPVAFRPVRGDS